MFPVKEGSLFPCGGEVDDIRVQNENELEQRIDVLFNELKSDIQNIECKDLSPPAHEIEKLKIFLNQIGLASTIELPAACDPENQIVPSPKIERFFQKFIALSLEEKVRVSQRLFNAEYKNHELYYFMFTWLVSSTYPKLKEYINLRNPTYERIFTLKGIHFAIEEWKNSGKLPPTLDYIVCGNVSVLADQIQNMLKKDSTQVIYFLQMDCNESLTGDHIVPIFMNKKEEEIEVVVTDSGGDRKLFLDTVCKFIRQQLPQATIWGFKLPRQTDMRSCFMLAFNDARVIAGDANAFIAFVRAQNSTEIEDGSYMLFENVPPQMLQFGQLSYNVHKMKSDCPELFRKLSKKEVLFNPQEENENVLDYRQKWMRKGVLITELQLKKETNISANKLFAKLERKALTKVFKHTSV